MATAAEPREYERTHPHITFRVDLSVPHPKLWLLLGEGKSKAEHVARTLLKPEASHHLMKVYLTKGALATTAIEGNTLTEEDAMRILEGELKLPPSREYLATEIENILAAYNRIKDELLESPDQALTPDRIAEYNRLILQDLDLEDGVVPGEIRDYSVTVGGVYRAAPPQDCEYLLERLCAWLNSPTFAAPADRPELAAPLAVIQAIVAHLYLAWIHPFGDGNGRTARLLELQLLLRAGFPAPVTQLLSNHYNFTRTEYYRQLNRVGRTGDVVPFLIYAAQGFVDELKNQLSIIWRMQFDDRWEQYVYQTFGRISSKSADRRLRLIKEISRMPGPVARSEMRQLTPALAESYAHLTDKALTRDLNALRSKGLLRRNGRGYVAEKDLIMGFMPDRVDGVLDVNVDVTNAPPPIT